MDVDEPRHHKIGGIVEQAVIARPPRRTLLGADIVEHAVLVEDHGLAVPGIVFAPGKQMAATDKGFHCRELPVEGTGCVLACPPRSLDSREAAVQDLPRERDAKDGARSPGQCARRPGSPRSRV
jgi:hypothetical protein